MNLIEKFYFSKRSLTDGEWENLIKNSDPVAIQKAVGNGGLKRNMILIAKKSQDIDLRKKISSAIKGCE